MSFGVLVAVILRINHTTSTSVFFYLGTIGVLSMLVAYFVMQIGAVKFLHLEKREPAWTGR